MTTKKLEDHFFEEGFNDGLQYFDVPHPTLFNIMNVKFTSVKKEKYFESLYNESFKIGQQVV